MKQSKKYTEEEKQEIIEFKKTHTWKEVKQKFNISHTTIKCWVDPEFRKKQLQYLKDDYINNANKPHRTAYRKENNKQKYNNNKELYKKINHEKYLKNKETVINYSHNYYRTHKKQLSEFTRKYRLNRYQNDPLFKIKSILRCRINQALRAQNNTKTNNTHILTGCNIQELKEHLEKQFQPGMTWENYGEWYIDHIKPCSSFDLANEDEQKKCFHYTNLQPLWAIDNLKKSDKYKKSLCIINCAAHKKDFKCPASQMYDDSHLFRAARDFAQKNFDEYIILSAKYGVLHPYEMIEPYEDTVMFVPNDLLHSGKPYKSLTADEKREWAKNVNANIDWEQYDKIIVLIGGYYLEFLEPYLEKQKNTEIIRLPSGISKAVQFIKGHELNK
jgi:hypothetical protein